MAICSVSSFPGENTECYYKGILIRQETLRASNGYSLDVIYFDDGVSRNLTVNRDSFNTEKRTQYREDVERYRGILSQIFANEIGKYKDDDAVRCIALRALTFHLTGMINLGKNQVTRLSESAGAVLVRTVDYTRLYKLEESFRQYFEESGSSVQKELLYSKFARLQMYQLSRIKYETLEESVKKNKGLILYHSEETGVLTDKIKFTTYLAKVKEYGQKTAAGTKSEEFAMAWHEWVRRSCQADCYTIVEPDMCDVLKSDIRGYDRTELKFVMIGEYVDGIVAMNRVRPKTSGHGKSIRKFVQNELEQWVNQSRTFPVVFGRDALTKEEPLWVRRIFPGADVISLDGTRESNTVFLILPLSRSMWNALIREKERGALGKEKYDSMVKDAEKAKMYIDWTYCWQAVSGENKLKKDQIWKEYVKLLDQIYKCMYFCEKKDKK